jgi:hypothetical protein
VEILESDPIWPVNAPGRQSINQLINLFAVMPGLCSCNGDACSNDVDLTNVFDITKKLTIMAFGSGCSQMSS